MHDWNLPTHSRRRGKPEHFMVISMDGGFDMCRTKEMVRARLHIIGKARINIEVNISRAWFLNESANAEAQDDGGKWLCALPCAQGVSRPDHDVRQ